MGSHKMLQGMEMLWAQSEAVLSNGVLQEFFEPIFDMRGLPPRPIVPGVEELELRVLNSLPSLDLYLRLFMREKET